MLQFGMDDGIFTALYALEWFRAMPKSCREALVSWGEPARFDPGQWLQGAGDVQGGNALLVEGMAGAYASVTATRDTLVAIVGPGTLLGASVSSGQAYATTIARTPTTVLVLADVNVARRGVDASELQTRIGQLHSRQFELLLERCAQRMALRTPARLAAELLFLEGQFQSHIIMVTQDELSEMTGVSRKTVNHWLRQVEARGIVHLFYRGLEIRDAAALRAIVAEERRA